MPSGMNRAGSRLKPGVSRRKQTAQRRVKRPAANIVLFLSFHKINNQVFPSSSTLFNANKLTTLLSAFSYQFAYQELLINKMRPGIICEQLLGIFRRIIC
jgi:hypothetical protein